MFIWRLYVDFADGIYSRERSVTLTSVSQLGIRPPQEPAAATQLRHLYSLGSWVRMWLRTFRSRKNILLQSYTAERERERERDGRRVSGIHTTAETRYGGYKCDGVCERQVGFIFTVQTRGELNYESNSRKGSICKLFLGV